MVPGPLAYPDTQETCEIRETSMRILLIVACAAAFVFSAWSNMPTSAESSDVTIDPTAFLTSTANAPTQQFDGY